MHSMTCSRFCRAVLVEEMGIAVGPLDQRAMSVRDALNDGRAGVDIEAARDTHSNSAAVCSCLESLVHISSHHVTRTKSLDALGARGSSAQLSKQQPSSLFSARHQRLALLIQHINKQISSPENIVPDGVGHPKGCRPCNGGLSAPLLCTPHTPSSDLLESLNPSLGL